MSISGGSGTPQAQRLTGAEFTQIVSLAFDALICTDAAQRIIFFNRCAEVTFGYSPEEVLGQPLDMLLPERFRQVHREHVMRFGCSSSASRLMGQRDAVLFGLRKSGEEFPIEASIGRIAGEQGLVFVVVLRDVSERRKAERERQFLAEFGAVLATLDHEETLRTISRLGVRYLGDFCVVDLIGSDGQPHRTERAHANAADAALVAEWRKVEEEHGPIALTPVLQTRQPFLVAEIPEGYLASIAPTPSLRRVLDAIRPVSMFALPLLAHGRLLGAVTFISTRPARRFGPEDVRVAREPVHRAALAIENARLYRTAQQAIQTRDEVLGIVAHDLRNPLQAIGLSAAMLLQKVAQDDPALRRLIDTIVHSSERASHLIRDLLEVTRLETGRLVLERTRQPVRQLLLEAVEMLTPAALSASLTLSVDAPPTLPLVDVDRDRILQVLSNLIGNAIKFTPAGGRITVAAMRRAQELLFTVTDTGPGVSAENLKRMFDRFYQVQPADRRGAGLGLHIAKAFVEAHGGRIWGESSAGQGTTLCFTLPLERRRRQSSATLPGLPTWFGKWRSRR